LQKKREKAVVQKPQCDVGSAEMAKKPGLYANINAKRARIAAGSGEKMRKVGAKGAPSAADFRKSAKTRKK
jgi:hypothetical protein